MISKAALKVAVGQLGQAEDPKGSNDGPMVRDYLRSVGIGPGNPWCAAFVYWCHAQAVIKMRAENPSNPVMMTVPRTAGVLDMWMKAGKLQYNVVDPQPGDVFIMDYGRGKGHTGFVEMVGDDVIGTIEGNTNDDGDREGYEVARRVRDRSKVVGYLRF